MKGAGHEILSVGKSVSMPKLATANRQHSAKATVKLRDDLGGALTLDKPVAIAAAKIDPLVKIQTPPSVRQTKAKRAKTRSAQESEMIGDLTSRWQTHGKASLELRHYTGRCLNALLGLPDKRQEYGAQLIEKVAKAIHVSVSEISRMRWFSHHFKSVEGLVKEHPTLQNWSEAKEVIAEMNTGRREKIHKPTSSFIRSLRTLAKKLCAGRNFDLNDDQRKDLQQAMQDLHLEVERKFNLRVGSPKAK